MLSKSHLSAEVTFFAWYWVYRKMTVGFGSYLWVLFLTQPTTISKMWFQVAVHIIRSTDITFISTIWYCVFPNTFVCHLTSFITLTYCPPTCTGPPTSSPTKVDCVNVTNSPSVRLTPLLLENYIVLPASVTNCLSMNFVIHSHFNLYAAFRKMTVILKKMQKINYFNVVII